MEQLCLKPTSSHVKDGSDKSFLALNETRNSYWADILIRESVIIQEILKKGGFFKKKKKVLPETIMLITKDFLGMIKVNK